MKDLIEYIAKALVDHPEEVQVRETGGNSRVRIELSVSKDDMGRVIGKGGKVANRELTLDLEPDNEKEHRQEPVVDPVEQRVREHARAPLEPQGRFPPRRECRSDGRVAEHQCDHRRQPQEQSR